MKRLLKILFVFVVIFVCVLGCSCKDNEDDGKVNLMVGDVYVETYEDIFQEDLYELIDNKENFLLFVYKYGCYGCELFKPVLKSVIKEKNLKVYGIEVRALYGNHELMEILEYTPTIALYEGGKIKTFSDPTRNPDYFNSKEGLLSFLDEYTYMPTVFDIDKTYLDKKISSGEEFIVYYTRERCAPCKDLKDNYLKEYLKDNHSTIPFYFFNIESEGVMINNGEFDVELWNSFKKQYGFIKGKGTFPNSTWEIPVFQYYKDGRVSDMVVYDYEKKSIYHADGTYTYVVEEGYYDDNPYIGQTLSEKEYNEKVTDFYNRKLKEFLDKNLKKVD